MTVSAAVNSLLGCHIPCLAPSAALIMASPTPTALQSFRGHLADMTPQRFANNVASLSAKYREPAKTLQDAAARMWAEVRATCAKREGRLDASLMRLRRAARELTALPLALRCRACRCRTAPTASTAATAWLQQCRWGQRAPCTQQHAAGEFTAIAGEAARRAWPHAAGASPHSAGPPYQLLAWRP